VSELTLAAVDPMFEKTQSPETQLPTGQDCVMEDLSQTPIPDVEDDTLTGARSPENEHQVLNPIKETSEQERDQGGVEAALMATSDTVQLPSFETPNLASALDQKPTMAHQDSKKNEYVEEFIADAATNMINALTRMMNSNHRRHSQPANYVDDLTGPSTELCNPKKEILQRILTAALDCLSEKHEPSGDSTSKVHDREPDKKDWIQCGVCAKRTRLRCEMKFVLTFLTALSSSNPRALGNTRNATSDPTVAHSLSAARHSAARRTGNGTRTRSIITSKAGTVPCAIRPRGSDT
jgi:hypothetical protein